MRIFLSGMMLVDLQNRFFETGHTDWLTSYAMLRENPKNIDRVYEFKKNHPGLKLMLDSGAYTMQTTGIDIPVDEYIGFLLKHKDLFEFIVGMDIAGDPVTTWNNSMKLRDNGIETMGVYHIGEPLDWIDKFAKEFPLFGFGSLAWVNTRIGAESLDSIFDYTFRRFTVNGIPTNKFHILGISSNPNRMKILEKYPIYSIDNTVWLNGGRTATIYTNLGQILFSDRRDSCGKSKKSILNLKSKHQDAVIAEIEKYGYKYETLCKDYKQRMKWNVEFFSRFARDYKDPIFKPERGELFE